MKKQEKNIHEQLIVDLIHTGNMIEGVISGLLKEAGITSVQYNILRILRGALPEPLTVGEVKNRILYSNSDVTRLIDRLVGKGVVSRKACEENRRRVHVSITGKGLNLLDELAPKIAGSLNNFYSSSVTNEDARHLSAVLRMIRQKS